MKPMKTVLASLAAAGLLFSQPLAAASARSGSIDQQSEELAGFGGGPGVALVAVLAVAVAAFWPVVFDDDDEDEVIPVSP